MRYWRFVETGFIFEKPEYWYPLHEGWEEATKEDYEAFLKSYRFVSKPKMVVRKKDEDAE